ncbi:MAG: hypothetical protein IJZ32_01100 [Clostridia bacterium]|nr:hypothetical protein [Clostridia bacterium]
MKMNFKKLASFALAAATLLAVGAGCGKKSGGVDLNDNAPDYSASTSEFMTFGYQAIVDDWYAVDGVRTYLDVSLLTKENIQIYKESGLNTLFINWVAGYSGPETNASWATSKTKQVMDWAYELDMDVFVFNGTLHELSDLTTPLIAENPDDANNRTSFASEEALDAYVKNAMGAVMSHPACIGVSIKDEPNWKQMPQIGAVYKSIKRSYPDAYVLMNLLPYSPGNGHLAGIESWYCEDYASLTSEEAYIKYLQSYLDYTGADYLQYDDYPIRGDNDTNAYVLPSTLAGAQITADFCKKNNLEMHKVFQTCSFKTSGWLCRIPDEDDMYWQLNVGMAMGIKGYSYWMYFPCSNTEGEYYVEDANFVDREGKPNPIYYTMQTLHGELQKMAKVLSYFDYQGLRTYTKAPIPGSSGFLTGVDDNDLKYVTDVQLEEGGVVLVTELYDAENDQYGYYIVNASDSAMAEEATQTLEISLKDFEKIQIHNMGEVENVALENGKYSVTLECGRGIFVLPY